MILSPDTNLLVHAHDERDPDKRRAALHVVEAIGTRGTSSMALQVAGELYAVLTRRLKRRPDLARDTVVATLRTFDSFGYDHRDVLLALTLAADGAFSYRDGLLATSAARAGCRYLISEDVQDGFRHGTLEIVAPFVDGGPNPRLADLLGSA